MAKVLTIIDTLQNQSWQSMTEILPGIVNDWKIAFESKGYVVQIHQIEKESLATILKSVLKSDLILFTAFNLQQNQLFQMMRAKLSLDIPIGLYLHGLASVGLWPLEKWGWLKLSRPQDFFIVTSEADLNCLKKIDLQAKVYKIPFSIEASPPQKVPLEKDFYHFIFTGRISEQKNLHTLLWGLSLVDKRIKQKIKLDIFGKEDNLGSPNMGKSSHSYLEILKELVNKLDLQENVTFHGFLPREILHEKFLSLHHTYISSSLHSDENFGMAALRSLLNGHQALLSEWGGHREFSQYFKNHVLYLPVYKTLWGPVISPLDIKNKIETIVQDPPLKLHSTQSCTPEIIQTIICDHIDNIFCKCLIRYNQLPKELSDYYTEKLLAAKEELKMSQVFDNYFDSKAHLFLESYGMVHQLPMQSNAQSITAPWVSLEGNIFKIQDPHRGSIELQLEDETKLFDFGLRWTVIDS